MDCSTQGFSVHHHLLERAQTHVHRVGDAIQPSHPRPLLLRPSVFPSIRVFSYESVLHIRWPKYWSFSFSISPYKEYLGWFPLELRRGTVISKRKESVVLDQDTPDLWVGVGGGKRTAGVFIMQIFSRKREEPRGPKRLNYPVSADQKILNWLSKIPREGWNSS